MKALVVLLLLATSAWADWEVQRDPFDRAVVARYRELLARDPHDPILGRLIAMYRRYRTIDELRRSYAGTDWASLVVRARIERGRDAARARELWREATALRRDDARAWLALAELQRTTAPAEARVAYRAALAATPSREALAIHVALAELAIAAHDLDDADTQLRAAIALDPSPARWLAHGDAMIDARPADALASYRAAEARATDPRGTLDAIERQAAAHGKLGDHVAALAALHRALARAPAGGGLARDVVARITLHARAGGRVVEELAWFEAAWPPARRGLFELVTLGELHEAAGAFERAIAAYEAAIAAAPREPLAHRQLVGLLDRLARPDEALARFEVLARDRPRDAAIQLELARRYVRAGREHEAVALVEVLARARPRDVGTQAAVADFYVATKNTRMAVVGYERLVQLDRSYRTSLAMAYAAAGDRRAVVRLAEASRAEAGQLGELGNLMLDYGMWSDAYRACDRAIELEPARAAWWSGRAGAREGREQWAEAVGDAAHALALTTTADTKILAALRHVVVRDVLRTADAEVYLRGWHAQLARKPAHRDLRLLVTELVESDHFNLELRVRIARDLRAWFPADVRIAAALVDVLIGSYRLVEALEVVDWIARQPGPRTETFRGRRERLVAAIAEQARDLAWQTAAMREGELVEVAPGPDAATQRLRIGLRGALGFGDDTRLLRLGAIATARLSDKRALQGRLDWTFGSTTTGAPASGPGGSVGLITQLARSPSTVWTAGGALRVDVRPGGARPVGVAAEAGVELTSRRTPFGLGLRLGRYLGGGTVANLELAVEWR